MCRLAIVNVLLILPILTSAQSGCSDGGKSYAHFEEFTHANGCAKLQCQNGTVVTTYEACGKEVDKKCHRVNEQFTFRRQTYICTKTSNGDYEIDLAPPATFTCTAEGREYKDLETFKLSDGCNNYQCQDGDISVTSPEACGKELDGECHYVGSWTSSKGKVYKCEKKVVSGKTAYLYTVIEPTPDLSKTCRLSSKTYKNLEIFRNRVDQCDSRQCQNGDMPYLNRVCRFSQDNRKCYPVGQRWEFNGRVFECTDVSGDSKAARAPPKYRNCTVGSTTYHHLETFTSGNGCETSQCQSGEVKVIESGCKDVSGQCYSPNYSWKVGTTTFKCVYNVDYGYTIARIFDDKPVPVCETPGKDVIFLLDDSGSIGSENFVKQKEFNAELTRRFYIGTNKSNAEYLFGAVVFNEYAYKVFDLNTHLSNSPLYQALLNIVYTAGWTRTDRGLDYIVDKDLFGAAAGGRSEADNFVVLITDGQSNEPSATQTSAARVRGLATVLAVGVGSGVNNVELQGITGDPSNVYNIESYDVLDQVKDKLSEKICTAP